MRSGGRCGIRQDRLKGWRWLEKSTVELARATPSPWKSPSLACYVKQSSAASTHRIKTSSRQYSLRRSIHAPSIPLQIPHDFPPTYLREHCSYLFDIGGIDGSAVRSWGGGRRLCEEEVADCDGGEGGEKEEGGNGEGLLLIWHLVEQWKTE